MKRNSLLTLLLLLSALFGSGSKASAQNLTSLINEGTNEELTIEKEMIESHRETPADFIPAPVDGERISLVLEKKGNIFIYDSVFEDSAWIDLNGNGEYDKGEALVNGFLSCKQEEVTIYGKISKFWLVSHPVTRVNAIDVSKSESLTYLDVSGQKLTSLDVSNNKALTTLYCNSNQLSNLNLSENKALTTLNCNSNQLTSLDLSTNKALTGLACNNNQLSSLNLSGNKALTTLYCNNNQLSNLDLSEKKALTTLYCNNNQLSSLDLSENKALTTLYCYNNQLSSLDLSANTSLTILNYAYNQLSDLDIKPCPDLKSISCAGNSITKLDISHNQKLEAIFVYDNKIQGEEMRKLIESLPILNMEEAINSNNTISGFSDLDILNSKNENEQNEFPLDLLPIAKAKGWVARDRGLNTDENGNTTFNDNAIGATYEVTPEYIDIKTPSSSLYIGPMGENMWVDLNENGQYDQGESIRSRAGINVVSGLVNTDAISRIRIYGKNITKISASNFQDIDLSNVKNLRRIWCSRGDMHHLNLKENKELRILQILGSPNLETIETDCPKLHTLYLSGDERFRPDLSLYPELKVLGVNNMGLTDIDLSHNPKLAYLDCYNNKLTGLDLSHTPKLAYLDCSYNKLTGLDLSHNPDLHYLNCSNNLINEAAMQALVESLPTVIIREEPGKFIPVNPYGNDANVCTADQVAIAKAKNWGVQTPMGEPFIGTSLDEIIPNGAANHNIKVWAQDGVLHLSGLEPGMPVQVYALSGTMMHSAIASGESLEIQLPRAATYVLRVGQYAVKAMIP